MIVGALGGLKFGRNIDVPPFVMILGMAALCGLAGCIVFLVDPRPAAEVPEGMPEHLVRGYVDKPSGVVGRFLAIVGCLLCWIPFVGLLLNLAGVAVNWKSRDWARTASLVGLVIGALSAIALAVGLALGIVD